MKAYTQKFLQKRKMMTLLPLMAIPFLCLFFWALGGGKGTAAEGQQVSAKGLNTEVPDARVNSGIGDKLSLYQQALRDSMKLEEQRSLDPYHNSTATDTTMGNGLAFPSGTASSPYPSYSSDYPKNLPELNFEDPNERKVRTKLAELQRQLTQEPELSDQPQQAPVDNAALEAQLQQMMASLQTGNAPGGTDLEMNQINSMLEKILDIQHPSRAREKLRQQSEQNKGQVFSVSTEPTVISADLLQPEAHTDSFRSQPTHNAFYEGSTNSGSENYQNKAIPAAVHESQTLESGATIKLRLLEDIYIGGQLIPKDNFVYGVCSLDGERLTVTVKYLRYLDNLYPVSLSVFDMDGIEGIRIPGAITRDATKQGLDQAIQSMELYSMDPSLGAQAATAGIQTAKTLLSRKAKTIRATVRAGYPVLLADQNRRDS
jgi:conjugative transposon TraM protein